MPQSRKFESDAEIQKVPAERSKAEWIELPRDGYDALTARLDVLTGRLDALQRAIADAAEAGDSFASECVGDSVETVLDKLIEAFRDRVKG